MNCKNCGNVINENDSVCSKCGMNVSNNQPVGVPLVQQETSFVNTETISIPQTPQVQPVQPTFVNTNKIDEQIKVKRKNPNTVLYIVLAIVVLVAIVCLTLVITQNK